MKTNKFIAYLIFFATLCFDIISLSSALNAAALNIGRITSVLLIVSFLAVFMLTPVLCVHNFARLSAADIKKNDKVKVFLIAFLSAITGLKAVLLWTVTRLLALHSFYLMYDEIIASDVFIAGIPVLMFVFCIAASCILEFNITISIKPIKRIIKHKTNKKFFRLKNNKASSAANEKTSPEEEVV